MTGDQRVKKGSNCGRDSSPRFSKRLRLPPVLGFALSPPSIASSLSAAICDRLVGTGIHQYVRQVTVLRFVPQATRCPRIAYYCVALGSTQDLHRCAAGQTAYDCAAERGFSEDFRPLALWDENKSGGG